MTTQPLSEVALKAAKKNLKRQESGHMKLKKLAKAVSVKVNDDAVTADVVKDLIRESSKFLVEGKLVSLKRKRKRNNDDTNKGGETLRTKTKKSSTPMASVDLTSVQHWRTEHKIVVMHATDDEEGKEKSAKLQTSEENFPFTSFDVNGTVNRLLIDQCHANKFKRPSPIQAQSWPILCRGRDMVGIAETGSGKTLAFAIPALSAMANSKSHHPRMLILAPTRELAMQSDAVLAEFGAVVNLRSLTVYGGIPKNSQVTALRKGVDCLVATPGRLKDLLQQGACNLQSIEHLVLDEADRMLDMGFEEDVRFIIQQCSQTRQTCMFSATWPAAIQAIAATYMHEPIRVYVGFEAIVGSNGESAVDDSLSANKRVQQNVEVVEDCAREGRLRQVLKQVHSGKNRVLIFALYKKEAERLEHSLRRDGFSVCSIHGNKNQEARTKALAEFKNGSCPLLVATDVAARGLDIPNVEAVINYTFPLTIEDYVHRIGRTGRAGKCGVSYTFFQPTDKSHAGELQQVLRQVGQDIPEALANFGSTIKKKEHKLYGNFGPKDGPMKKATKIVFNYDD